MTEIGFAQKVRKFGARASCPPQMPTIFTTVSEYIRTAIFIETDKTVWHGDGQDARAQIVN
jgi:hypothetical protein